MTYYVRARLGEQTLRAFGPKDAKHPSVGSPCAACGGPLAEGDLTTLVALGPGEDEEYRERAREGRWYNAVAVECHYACATGGEV